MPGDEFPNAIRTRTARPETRAFTRSGPPCFSRFARRNGTARILEGESFEREREREREKEREKTSSSPFLSWYSRETGIYFNYPHYSEGTHRLGTY